MSDINCKPSAATSSDDGVDYYGMPYDIKTYFRSKKIVLLIPGLWTGSASGSGITMSAAPAPDGVNTLVTYQFEGTAGATLPATLSSGSAPPYQMTLTCFE
jgi:hypothetical protein